MPSRSKFSSDSKGLCLLSIDAGGTRGISQLKILANLMHRYNFETEVDDREPPCNIFDMIGGSGSGGFTAILLGVLGLTAEQALDEFIDLSVNILDAKGVDAPTRTAELRNFINNLLKKYGILESTGVIDPNGRSRGCKIVVPITYRHQIGSTGIIRNFDSHQEQATHWTVADALLATLATPPLFTPSSISKDAATFEYIGGDFILGNPVREVIAEAHGIFGREERVACLLSLGCGYPGASFAPENANLDIWSRLLEKLVTDSEQKAQSADSQMGHLGLYYRFSVTKGLEDASEEIPTGPGAIIAHTTVYLGQSSLSRKADLCVQSLDLREGVASLDQLKRSGGDSLLPLALPPLTRTFVMRKEPWEFIKRVMLGTRASEADGPRMLVMTGMGGCGKTQLLLKFMRVYEAEFTSLFFVDGSSVSRIRSDIIRHVRSLGTEHSQKSFDDCLLFLSRTPSNAPRLILYDNVDDPDLDLPPLLPPGDACAILITSRNRLLGGLAPEAHLELDVMSMGEAIELLVHSSKALITDEVRVDAAAVAQALGRLPIALTQARSYIAETKCSLTAYLKRLLSSQETLLSQPVRYQREMRYSSTFAAFDASFQRLPSRVQRFLRLLSHLYRSDFPLDLVILAAKHSFSNYNHTYIDHGDDFNAAKTILEDIFLIDGEFGTIDLDNMLISLQNYSLTTLHTGIDTRLLSLHPILHQWVYSCTPEAEQPAYQSAAVLLLALGAREDRTPSAKYLASHVFHFSYLWDEIDVNNAEAFAHILAEGGLPQPASRLRERVVIQLRFQANLDGRHLADSLQKLATSYNNMGNLKMAETHQDEVLKLRREILGENHLETVRASSWLALTYRDMGRLREAELLQLDVLERRMDLLGERHLDTIMASNNLANTYRDLKRPQEARVLQENVLKLRKQILGERHSHTIMVSHSLSLIYAELGRWKEAEMIQERVLKLRKEILGERHPHTLTASNHLASIYCRLGRLSEAETIQLRILDLMREVLGERHSYTTNAMLTLAAIYEGRGNPHLALSTLKAAEIIISKTLGKEHRQYAECREIASRMEEFDTLYPPGAFSLHAVKHSSLSDELWPVHELGLNPAIASTTLVIATVILVSYALYNV